ncbi:IclR family transcriptional regulator [Ornithinimicrobium sufpigmenti]|uniref:IclR family transcriptional regulator n=1 Tax=Ornithinimicrobium sufpigmenti TaxID=2508882 RepID=UPI00103595F7|nr:MULTISPECIES: IclR family transcriptional regulator [unclassified Ornithinimicrobium]
MPQPTAPGGHRTVSRVIGILEYVASRPEGARLAEIADAVQAPKSSTHGFLRGLLAAGYVSEGTEKQTYQLGWGAHAMLLSQENSLIELTRAVREEMLDRFNETITLAVRVGDHVVYLESLTPTHAISYQAATRVRRPLWPTSAGKIFLSHLPEPEVGRILLREEAETDLRDVDVELATVRESGLAFNIGESQTDVAAVAVPLAVGGLSAAISIAGPVGRIEEHLPRIGRTATEVVRAVDLTTGGAG